MGIISSFLLLVLAQSTPVPAGTHLKARLESSVKTDTSKAGDAVSAVLSEPIRTAGRIVVPQGSRLHGRIETIEPATGGSEGRVRLAFREIQFSDGRRVTTWITNSFAAPVPNHKRRYWVYMAAGGAAGALIGGKAARVAGVLGGTLAGFVIAGNSGDDKRSDLHLQAGQTLLLQLLEDLELP